MTLWEDIRRRRKAGVVQCGLVTGVFESPEDCARFFHLDPNGVCQRYTPDQARQVLRLILRQDLAYDSPIMREEEAERLVAAFAEASLLEERETRAFGNMDAENIQVARLERLRSWQPATVATFDTGVLVIGRDRCACLWVEDED